MFAWDDLRVFLHLAREGTLSAAARTLGVDQSTVGRRLNALEDAAGTRLFDRSHGGYVLSAAGEAVLASAEQVEAQTLAIEQKLRGHDGADEGTVRLATSDSLATWFLVRHLPRLRERHPGIALELVTGNRPVDLGRREADISLRLTKPTQEQLVARRLGVAAWSVYAANSYVKQRGLPSLSKQFQGHDVIAFDTELAGTIGAKWMREHTAKASVVLTTNSLTCQAEAVLAGLGISALPCVFGDREPSVRRVLADTVGQHEVWLVVHPDVRASARVRAVLDYLTQLIRAEAPLLSGQPKKSRQRQKGG
jgi:DNA-binding transcriptional LysR family regulator